MRMAQKAKTTTRRGTDEDTGDAAASAETAERKAAIDEEVACCLAEIDKMLDEAETERERALREFRELKAEGWDWAALNVWKATYAHLGLKVGASCCGGPYVYNDNDVNPGRLA